MTEPLSVPGQPAPILRHCPSTYRHDEPGYLWLIGTQCKFWQGHDGDHCGRVDVDYMPHDVWWADKPQSKTPEECLREWHAITGIEGGMELRDRLLKEEYEEYLAARLTDDDVELADALADMVYIIVGTAVVLDMPFDRIFAEVHRSNMTKLVDGKVTKRDDGKVLKPDTFEPPRIAEILNENL